MTCLISGEAKGVGRAAQKAMAKEDAAQKTWEVSITLHSFACAYSVISVKTLNAVQA